jgi:hypothetical protein
MAATPVVPETPASGETETETETDGAAETEPTTDAEEHAEEPDLVGQEHPGAGEVEEVEDSHNESATHDDPLPQDDPTTEPDTDTLQSQSQTAEDIAGAEENDQSDQAADQAALPGESEAEISVPETEAEAAPEHEAESETETAPEPEAARLDEVKPRQSTVSNELESMVNMLEGGPPSFRPPSTHLDVAGEIPDEE